MLLCLVMIFSMMTVAVPVHAAPVASTTLTVAADKTTAAPGDEITYTITMGPVSDLGSIQMVLDIPAGLSYVAGSGSLASGLKATLAFDDVAFTENMATGRHIINGTASAADYESAADTVIATFRCTVDAGATGTLEVGLTELEFISCQTFDDITSRFSVVKTAVAISGATPPPATYTVSFNANGGTGTMAEVTGVSAGAYTLPANGFTAPDGKRFVGWATSAGGTAIAAGGTITVSANVTLYAIWEEIPTSHPAKPTLGITGTYTYSGSAQTVTVTGFDSTTMLISGNVGTNAGSYTASVTSKSGRWADGTSTPVTIEWSIGRKTVTPVIRVSGTYTYTGTPVEPTFTVEDGGVVISTSEYARTITDNDAVGTGKITVSDKTGGNYEILTTSQTFEISAPTPPPTVYTSTEIKITADKTDAKAGDEITFTITMGPVSDLGTIQMVLDIPAGLSYVAGSGSLAAGLKAKLGFDSVDYTEGTKDGKPRIMINGVASAADYESAADTVIATFKCTVDAGATGTLEVGLTELEFVSCQKTEIHTSRFSVVPATITVADSRTKVSEVAGTSDLSTILVYGGAYKKPTVTVTTGAPAYFNINSANGKWLKKNSAGDWDYYTGATFTEGTYKFDCQVRIDGAAGLTHVLDSAGVTVTVDGAAWTTGTPDVDDDYSLVGVNSPEYTVTAPAGTPLAFAKNDKWNIGDTQNGVAITSFSVESGASGGTAPYTFSKVSGPAWLQVAPDGTVSGTPTAAGANENLVIRVTDSAGTPATADITLTVGNTAVSPADRTKVNKVEGTSDISTILVYGGAYKKPTVTVTTGAPAYFNINSANGKWLKKNSAGDWDYYTEPTFTEGTYKFDCQVRIDDAAGLTHVLDSAGVTVTVDGVAWTTGTPDVDDDYSLVGVNSPEYTVTSPSATTYTVTVTAGANMTTTGSATQNVNVGDAMAEIICTAADGYYFPTDYTVAAVNGITVTRIDFTKVKVSGTPTAATNITLTAPTAKTKEATPTAVFTANGTDSGKLTGIAAGMKYRINGGAWMDITATEANLTGLSACTITIKKSGNGTTTIDSDEQTITVTKAAKPALTPTLLTLTGGKGSIPTTAAHEFGTDGMAWTPCTGATENLDTGKYYVRVKANGTQLASENQEIDIFLYGDANGDGKVDIDDLTRLRRYNAEASTVIFPGADANGDGTVDIYDLTRLRRYFAEEAVVLGK